MPVYEYACGKCGHEFEAEQRITEPPIKTCPRCHARKVKRLISQTSFVLKGSGWYADLYASKSAKETAASKSDAPAAKTEAPAKPPRPRPPPRHPPKRSRSPRARESAGKGKAPKAAA